MEELLIHVECIEKKKKKGIAMSLTVVGVAWIRIRDADAEQHEGMEMKNPLKMRCDKIKDARDEFNEMP